MNQIYSFLNPVKWIRAWSYANKCAKFDKSSYDLELFLYANILKNNMLHYGYFENKEIDPATISLKLVEDAQLKYAQNIVDFIANTEQSVLDVGCGMGGLSEMIHQRGCKVESLTPNKNQIEFINKTYTYLRTHNCKFEDFGSEKRFGTVINSESLQYISLTEAFEKVERILLPNGRWIIVDYFRLNDSGISKSAHLLKNFHAAIEEHQWKIVHEQDITLNILPTLKFANMYIDRFLTPVKHFAYEKLRYKKPALYYMTDIVREKIDKKIAKEVASIDPVKFVNEKKYIFFVLEKK